LPTRAFANDHLSSRMAHAEIARNFRAFELTGARGHRRPCAPRKELDARNTP
jgi:hypothetical protein